MNKDDAGCLIIILAIVLMVSSCQNCHNISSMQYDLRKQKEQLDRIEKQFNR